MIDEGCYFIKYEINHFINDYFIGDQNNYYDYCNCFALIYGLNLSLNFEFNMDIAI